MLTVLRSRTLGPLVLLVAAAVAVGVAVTLGRPAGPHPVRIRATAAVRPAHPEAAKVSPPPVNGRFDYQIGGAYRPVAAVSIVDRDWHERPVPGRYNICYINAFQSQPDDPSRKNQHPDLLLHDAKGKLVEDPDWPGEFMLDTSTAAKRQGIAAIEDGWLDSCARAGFQGVEPDNLDSFSRSENLLSTADNLALAALLAQHAHGVGLAIAQKNTVEISRRGHDRVGFDFAIAEECQQYTECDGYLNAYGRHVIEIEYDDNPLSAYSTACQNQGKQISVILRDRDVVPSGTSGYDYRSC